MDDVETRREWEAWQAVVEQLKKLGAVTVADSMATGGEVPDTPGKVLLELLRTWGDCRREA